MPNDLMVIAWIDNYGTLHRSKISAGPIARPLYGLPENCVVVPKALIEVTRLLIERLTHDEDVPNEISQDCASILIGIRALIAQQGQEVGK